MDLEETVNATDPHHIMVAGAGATIGYLSYLLWPAYLVAPYAAAITGGLFGYFAAKSVKD